MSSAEPGVGKSMVVSNLAAALAELGRSVIVVDADLRHPSQHLIFGKLEAPGLRDVLQDMSCLDGALQQTSTLGLRLLADGAAGAEAFTRLFVGAGVADLVRELGQRADLVLWDSAACVSCRRDGPAGTAA